MSEPYYDQGYLKINLERIFNSMSEDDQKSFINELSLQSSVIEYVVSYICGNDEFGSWTSDDQNLRQNLLERVEKAHKDDLIEFGPRYSWEIFRKVETRLKDIQTKKNVYWALYHDEELQRSGFSARRFFEKHGIESNYTTKDADKDIEACKQIIIDAVKELK